MNKRLNLFLLLSGLLSMIAGCSEESFNSDTTGSGDIRFRRESSNRRGI